MKKKALFIGGTGTISTGITRQLARSEEWELTLLNRGTRSEAVPDGVKVIQADITDEVAVARAVSEAGYDPYEKKLLGITAMQKQLGRKKFDQLLSGLVVKPQGKPVLAPNTDTRPEFNTAAQDFMEESDYE